MLRRTDTEILRRTHTTAMSMVQKVAARARPSSPSCVIPLPQSNLVLPLPQSLDPQLLSLGVDNQSSARISSVLLDFTRRFRQLCEDDFIRRRSKIRPDILPSLVTAYSAIYTRAIQNWTTYLLQDVIPRVIRAQRLRRSQRRSHIGNPNDTQHSRRTFNHVRASPCPLFSHTTYRIIQNAIPSLERFFSQNAFPSRLEKHELASQCEMEYRQIHVWVSIDSIHTPQCH